MTMTTAGQTALLNLLFKNADWPNIGDAAGLQNSVADGSFYIALHTASPGAGGDQTTNEATYTGYGRVTVARNTGFTLTGATITNAGAVNFGACTAGTNTITHFSIGVATSGASLIVAYGTCSLSVSSGITPAFAAGQLSATAA